MPEALYEVKGDARATLAGEGAIAAKDMADLAAKLTAPRTVWIMVPASVTDSTIAAMAEHLEKGVSFSLSLLDIGVPTCFVCR